MIIIKVNGNEYKYNDNSNYTLLENGNKIQLQSSTNDIMSILRNANNYSNFSIECEEDASYNGVYNLDTPTSESSRDYIKQMITFTK